MALTVERWHWEGLLMDSCMLHNGLAAVAVVVPIFVAVGMAVA